MMSRQTTWSHSIRMAHVDEKQAVIQSMMIMDNAEGLISLMKDGDRPGP